MYYIVIRGENENVLSFLNAFKLNIGKDRFSNYYKEIEIREFNDVVTMEFESDDFQLKKCEFLIKECIPVEIKLSHVLGHETYKFIKARWSNNFSKEEKENNLPTMSVFDSLGDYETLELWEQRNQYNCGGDNHG